MNRLNDNSNWVIPCLIAGCIIILGLFILIYEMRLLKHKERMGNQKLVKGLNRKNVLSKRGKIKLDHKGLEYDSSRAKKSKVQHNGTTVNVGAPTTTEKKLGEQFFESVKSFAWVPLALIYIIREYMKK